MVMNYLEGNTQKALDMQVKALPLVDALFCEVNPIPVKTAMNLMGWNVGPLREPLSEMEPDHVKRLAKAMEERPDIKYVADIKPDSAEELKAKFGDRVFFTPKKMGAQTAEANINAGIAAAQQTVAFLRDGVNRFQVNK